MPTPPVQSPNEAEPGPEPQSQNTLHSEITARLRAELSLRDSESHLRALTDSMPQLVWLARPDGYYLYFNQQWYDYSGATLEQSQGDGWSKVLHPDDYDRVLSRWQHSLATGDPYDIECRFRRAADDAYRWFIGRALPVRDSGGAIIGWAGTCTDIEDQKQAEANLRSAERFARATLDGLSTQIAILDGSGVILAVNRAWRDFAAANGGVSDSVGKNYLAVCDGSDGSDPIPVAQGIRAVIAGERDLFLHEYPCDSPDEARWFILRATPFPGDGPAHVVVAHENITARKAAESALRRRALQLARSQRLLARSNRELDQFAYVTSHDLKAPLRGIANLSRWIEEDLGDKVGPETRQQLELLRGRVNRMDAMIEGILRYSRIGRVNIEPESVDVSALLAEIVDLLAPPPDFTVVIAPPMPTLHAEKVPLQQVFQNLISNAIKHNPRPGGKAVVTCEDAGTFVLFAVSDDGPGIAPQYHEKVFQMFQTLEARDKVEGTGIGLALVKKIVEQQGGTLQLDSDVGRGTAFRFTWPKTTRLADKEDADADLEAA